MRYLILEDLKKHLNVEHNEDDCYISQLGDVAEQALANQLCQPLEDVLVEGQLPSPLLQALRLHVGTLYNNRESVVGGNVHELPMGYDYLITAYKQY